MDRQLAGVHMAAEFSAIIDHNSGLVFHRAKFGALRRISVGLAPANLDAQFGSDLASLRGYHLYLYILKGEGTKGKFDARWPVKNSALFLFRDQVYDNIFWTSGMGVLILTGYEAMGLWLFANHYIPYLSWKDHPVWFGSSLYTVMAPVPFLLDSPRYSLEADLQACPRPPPQEREPDALVWHGNAPGRDDHLSECRYDSLDSAVASAPFSIYPATCSARCCPRSPRV